MWILFGGIGMGNNLIMGFPTTTTKKKKKKTLWEFIFHELQRDDKGPNYGVSYKKMLCEFTFHELQHYFSICAPWYCIATSNA